MSVMRARGSTKQCVKSCLSINNAAVCLDRENITKTKQGNLFHTKTYALALKFAEFVHLSSPLLFLEIISTAQAGLSMLPDISYYENKTCSIPVRFPNALFLEAHRSKGGYACWAYLLPSLCAMTWNNAVITIGQDQFIRL